MEVIDYIRENGLEQLKTELSIKVREYPDRIVLNYNQIESPKFDPIVQECRGLILSWPYLDVLSRSFDRFYNYGEINDHSTIDIKEYIGFQKIDGSLINIYFDGEKWNCATRGTAYAEGPTSMGDGKTFRDIIETVIIDLRYNFLDFTETWNEDMTYIFELVSPDTRVVKPYSKPELYLLAVRNKYTGQYIDGEGYHFFAEHFGISIPNIYRFNTIDDCIKASKELIDFDEGYVLYNPRTQHRIKVKSPAYLAIAHLRGNGVLSPKKIVNLVFMQEYEEYLSIFPEDRKFFEPYIEAYSQLIINIKTTWETVKNIENQKDFAMQVKDIDGIRTFMFQMRKGISISDIINRLTDNSKFELLQTYKCQKN